MRPRPRPRRLRRLARRRRLAMPSEHMDTLAEITGLVGDAEEVLFEFADTLDGEEDGGEYADDLDKLANQLMDVRRALEGMG